MHEGDVPFGLTVSRNYHYFTEMTIISRRPRKYDYFPGIFQPCFKTRQPFDISLFHRSVRLSFGRPNR
jgi:hypothetical protein